MRFSKSVSIILVYIFAMFFLPVFSLIFLREYSSITELLSLQVYVNLISYVFLAVVTLSMFGRHLIEDFKEIPSIGHFLKGILSGWALLLVALFSSNILLFTIIGPNESSTNQQVIVSTLEAHPILMAITTVILAPVIEEIIFRLTLMKKTVVHPWFAILFSSFLFGLIHVISARDFIFIIPYMAMGIPLGYSYHKTRNICYPIGIHVLQNLFASFATIIPLLITY